MYIESELDQIFFAVPNMKEYTRDPLMVPSKGTESCYNRHYRPWNTNNARYERGTYSQLGANKTHSLENFDHLLETKL